MQINKNLEMENKNIVLCDQENLFINFLQFYFHTSIFLHIDTRRRTIYKNRSYNLVLI